jgi:Flp pilus assembly protein TadG
VATIEPQSRIGRGVWKPTFASWTGRLLRMTRRSRRTLLETRREDGQAFVEFIIILPILLAVIFIVVGYAVALSNYGQATDVARTGARAASIARFAGNNNPCAAATTAINNTKGNMTLVGAPTCSFPSGNSPGNPIKVTVTVVAQNVLSSIPLISAALPGSACGSQRCWTSSATAVLQ